MKPRTQAIVRQSDPPRIFLSPPHLGDRELAHVQAAFASNYIAPLGPMVDAFEREFAEYTGIPYCLALASGTAATHLALRHRLAVSGCGFQGSVATEQRPLVIASTLTFIGSVTPAVYEGCELVFIDCDRETWNMDPSLLEEELNECAVRNRLPAVVIPTDLYGQCCDLPRIQSVCDRFGVPVICDSAEAVGSRYREKTERRIIETQQEEKGNVSGDIPRSTLDNPCTWSHAGTDAWAAVYSFNGNKIITTSGGGMLASYDEELIRHARKLSQQARDPTPWYEHSELGYNYRMSNILAAIGRGQLEVIEERVVRRRAVYEAYHAHLGRIPGISFMPEASYGRSNRWLTVILIDPAAFGKDTQAVREALERENIESRPVWKPMHLQPLFKGRRMRGGRIAEEIFQKGLCLPSGSAMTAEEIERVSRIVATCPQRTYSKARVLTSDCDDNSLSVAESEMW